jgi:hypothetical protein
MLPLSAPLRMRWTTILEDPLCEARSFSVW